MQMTLGPGTCVYAEKTHFMESEQEMRHGVALPAPSGRWEQGGTI